MAFKASSASENPNREDKRCVGLHLVSNPAVGDPRSHAGIFDNQGQRSPYLASTDALAFPLTQGENTAFLTTIAMEMQRFLSAKTSLTTD